MQTIRQDIQVAFRYDVHFVTDAFRPGNDLLGRILGAGQRSAWRKKILPVIDEGLLPHYPDLRERIQAYFAQWGGADALILHPPVLAPAGEAAKNDPALVGELHAAIRQGGLCRHSFVLAIGGGSVLDLAGYAAATAHRGVRLVRMPTTVLAQNDSGVGVKNSVNALRAKNFLGTFAPPYAVVNDFSFLASLSDRDWRSGMAEAVKVALVKDAAFFGELETEAERLAPPPAGRGRHATAHLPVRRAASGPYRRLGGPFRDGKLPSPRLRTLGRAPTGATHGLRAAARGSGGHRHRPRRRAYSHLCGLLSERDRNRTLDLIETMGFRLYAPEIGERLKDPDHPRSIFQGLEAFREHLGGTLTIMLLAGVGRGVEVHEVDLALYRQAIALLGAPRPPRRSRIVAPRTHFLTIMRIRHGKGLELTYCANIHPGETLTKVAENLRTHAVAVKQEVSPDAPMGVGLRLSRRAADALTEKPGRLKRFRRLLDKCGLYAFTINGFPYGNFHRQRVKDQVYKPDWRTPERRIYTERLGSILAQLLPEGAEGSISTSPVSYKPWL